ncbi:NfeD family protein [Halorhodospira abdelmalekii]|uniref:NfeD family protein n=1 Tax=Halorhodospira abdelmalekii TaxID=421629 RepID=UPI001907559E|nr:NfeD family protein [Halorhodospira abdelmalekii]
MQANGHDLHPALRYWLIQLPGLLLIGVLASIAASFGLIDASTAVLLFLLWLVKDLVLYPVFIRTEGLHYPMGRDALIGAQAEVVRPIEPEGSGQVRVHGELWQARSVDGRRFGSGQLVEIFGVDGLTLFVKPIPQQQVNR